MEKYLPDIYKENIGYNLNEHAFVSDAFNTRDIVEIKVDEDASPGQMDHREAEKKHREGQIPAAAAEMFQQFPGVAAPEHHRQQYRQQGEQIGDIHKGGEVKAIVQHQRGKLPQIQASEA